MLALEGGADGRGAVIDPDDLIQQPIRAEDLVQQQAGIGGDAPVQVKVQRPGWRQQAVHKPQPRLQHAQVFPSAGPAIDEARAGLPLGWASRVLLDPGASAEGLAGQEWRIGVDQVHPALQVGQQRLHHRQIVPMDQPILLGRTDRSGSTREHPGRPNQTGRGWQLCSAAQPVQRGERLARGHSRRSGRAWGWLTQDLPRLGHFRPRKCAPGYMTSGARMSSSHRLVASICRAAAVSFCRAARIRASSACRTGTAW